MFKTLSSEAVLLVMSNPSMNELWATQTGQWIYLYGSRSLTARSQKGCTRLKIRPQVSVKWKHFLCHWRTTPKRVLSHWQLFQL